MEALDQLGTHLRHQNPGVRELLGRQVKQAGDMPARNHQRVAFRDGIAAESATEAARPVEVSAKTAASNERSFGMVLIVTGI